MADEGKKGGVLGDLVKAEGLLQIAFVLPICCLIGCGLGYLLDKHFGTSWLIVVGIVLGAAAGFVSVIRTATQFMKRSGS